METGNPVSSFPLMRALYILYIILLTFIVFTLYIYIYICCILLRVRGVTCPKIYELTPPHGTPLTPRPQELTPCANHHGTPALTDRFFGLVCYFPKGFGTFYISCEFFDLTPNVKERMAHLQIVFYQPKFSDVIPIVGTTYLISKNVIHDGFPHWHTEYIQVLR